MWALYDKEKKEFCKLLDGGVQVWSSKPAGVANTGKEWREVELFDIKGIEEQCERLPPGAIQTLPLTGFPAFVADIIAGAKQINKFGASIRESLDYVIRMHGPFREYVKQMYPTIAPNQETSDETERIG